MGVTRVGNKWKAQVRRKGYPAQYHTFMRKSDAERWVRETELKIEQAVYTPSSAPTFTPLRVFLNRYREEIVPHLRSAKSECSRLATLESHLGDYALPTLTPALLATYRQQRLKERSPQTVTHELKLLQRVLRRAIRDWGAVLPGGIPSVTPPRCPPGRNRVLTPDEETRLLAVATEPLRSLIVLAVETAARRKELLALRAEDVNRSQHLLLIRPGKTDTPRIIPLTARAQACLDALGAIQGAFFTLHPDTVYHQFARACQAAEIKGLTFHDLRHTATTRFAEQGLDTLELALITGHRSLDMLKRYAHLSASRIADKLWKDKSCPL
jgi:integrase